MRFRKSASSPTTSMPSSHETPPRSSRLSPRAAATPFIAPYSNSSPTTNLSPPSGNLSNSAGNTTDSRAFSGRLDFNLTQKDNMFVRGGVIDATSTSGLAFISSNLVGNGAVDVDRDANITLSETHSFSPRLINNFLSSNGRSSPNFTPTSKNVRPFVAFNDGTDGLGPWNGIPQGRTQNTFQYLDTVTYNIGSHTLKAGYELNRVQSNGGGGPTIRGADNPITPFAFPCWRPT